MSDDDEDVDDSVATLDKSYEREVVGKAMQDTAFLKDAAVVLESHRIADEHVAWAWGVTRETWLSLAERPTSAILIARATRDFPDAKKRSLYLKTISSLLRVKPTSPRASLEEIRRFVKMAHYHDALMKSAKALKDSDPDEAERELRLAFRTAPRKRDYELVRWADEFEERQAARRHAAEHPELDPVIPTGIPKLDKLINGGVRRGWAISVAATTNKGKSIFLNNIGWHAMARGFKVAHLTTEMTALEQADRYDSRFTLVEYDKFKKWAFSDKEIEFITKRFDRWRDKLKNNLRICGMPVRRSDMATVRQICADMREEMGGLDVVIVDSLDHLLSTVRHKEIRLDQAEVYWEAKQFAQEGIDIGGERNPVALYSSTQAGKEWAEIIATAESGSESYDKGRIVDLMFTLNTPKRDRRRKRGGMIEEDEDRGDELMADGERRLPRLEGYVAKNRHGRSRVRIPLEADLARIFIKEGLEDEPEEEAA